MTTFGNERRRIEFVLGRAAARTLLSELTGIAPDRVPLNICQNGAPELAGGRYHVSITHTADVAAVVVASRPAGIDLEAIKPRHPSLERYLVHPDETELLMPDRERSLMLLWTLKEAALKASGVGLRLAPKHLLVQLEAQPGTATIYQPDGLRWQALYEEREGMYLAIAFQ